MRCHDVKEVLAQRDTDAMNDADKAMLQEHLEGCESCCAFEQRQSSMDVLLRTSQKTAPPPMIARSFSSTGSVSTRSIMQAVQQHRQISQQLETLHEQQRSRVARLRTGGTALAAILFFTLGSIPLLLLAVTLVQTDFMVHVLRLLSHVVDVLYVLGQYIQTGLTVVTHNSFLLAGVSFVVVLMMGMWLRLMRPPREA